MKTLFFGVLFKPGLLRCHIGLVLEGGPEIAKNGLEMGVTNGGTAAKSGKNIHFLV